MAGFERFLIVVDAVAQIQPHPLPEVAPTQLVDQLSALIAVANPRKNRIAHLRQGEHAVAYVGGKTGDGTLEMVTAFGVALGVDAPQLLVGRFATSADRAEDPLSLRELLRQQAIQLIA